MAGTVVFDRPTYKRLKLAYAKAVKENRDTFMFEGHELLTAYAKYLLQYLDTALSK